MAAAFECVFEHASFVGKLQNINDAAKSQEKLDMSRKLYVFKGILFIRTLI